MLPWGHLAVGYLSYTFFTRLRYRRGPNHVPVLVLAAGTQFPDLVDKPLNWWFSIFDGRGIGHSIPVTVVLCTILFVWAERRGHTELALAFSIGVFTHLLADAWTPLFSGNLHDLSFLLWPIFPAPTYPKDSLVDHLEAWYRTVNGLSGMPLRDVLLSRFGIQFVLLAGMIWIWAHDGFPGVPTEWLNWGNRTKKSG